MNPDQEIETSEGKLQESLPHMREKFAVACDSKVIVEDKRGFSKEPQPVHLFKQRGSGGVSNMMIRRG